MKNKRPVIALVEASDRFHYLSSRIPKNLLDARRGHQLKYGEDAVQLSIDSVLRIHRRAHADQLLLVAMF